MKFAQMTADEIKTYRGKVHWAEVEYLNERGAVLLSYIEEPTYSDLHDIVNGLRSPRIFRSGIRYRFSDGRTVALPDFLRSATLTPDDIEASLAVIDGVRVVEFDAMPEVTQ